MPGEHLPEGHPEQLPANYAQVNLTGKKPSVFARTRGMLVGLLAKGADHVVDPETGATVGDKLKDVPGAVLENGLAKLKRDPAEVGEVSDGRVKPGRSPVGHSGFGFRISSFRHWPAAGS